LEKVRSILKNPKELQTSLENLINENTKLKQRTEQMENRILIGLRNELMQNVKVINGVNFVGEVLEVNSVEALKKLCYDLKNHLENYVVVLCANIEGKAAVAIGIDDRLVATKNLDAGKLIREQVAPIIKGGGGGQKNLATAGGTEAGNLPSVIESIKAIL
jgi:alanyl-tRNA synthetase